MSSSKRSQLLDRCSAKPIACATEPSRLSPVRSVSRPKQTQNKLTIIIVGWAQGLVIFEQNATAACKLMTVAAEINYPKTKAVQGMDAPITAKHSKGDYYCCPTVPSHDKMIMQMMSIPWCSCRTSTAGAKIILLKLLQGPMREMRTFTGTHSKTNLFECVSANRRTLECRSATCCRSCSQA